MKKLWNLIWDNKTFRVGAFVIGDAVIAVAAAVLALLFRFDFGAANGFRQYFPVFLKMLPLHVAATLAVYVIFRFYRIMWSQASLREALRIAELNLFIAAIEIAFYMFLQRAMPRSFYPLSFLFQCALEFLFRYSYRMLKNLLAWRRGKGPRTMIFGAGNAGHTLGHEMQTSVKSDGRLICYLDDKQIIQGKTMNGIPVLGTRDDIERVAREQKIEQIIIAIPSASPQERAAITEICQRTGCRVRTLPGIYQMINGDVSVSQLRPVEIEDLLGREQVKVDLTEIASYVKGKIVLVTGGGGSIGSELCRQIAGHGPKLLIIFDIYENNAYDIQQELKKNYPDMPLLTLIGSVRNTERITQVMRDYRPDIVYHAAAHKHVPLMEDSPKEAIKNNVFGTLKTAQAAGEYGVRRFVLISTDKAVNPTNIMGASKRMCEMVVQMMDRRYPNTDFVAVRFGNVLGSNGSVIPLFKKQIAAGGPVTVTDKNIIRYFMTIPEAVSLVLQAGAYAKGGEIFVLDMGRPVKILTLAENLIRLSGFEPYTEIPIVFTGLRPGEKLYEEMLMSEEGMQDTPNHLIHIGKPIEMDYDKFARQLRELYPAACSDEGGDGIKRLAAEIVPTYRPQFREDPYLSENAGEPPEEQPTMEFREYRELTVAGQ